MLWTVEQFQGNNAWQLMILIFRSQRTLIRFQKFFRWQFAHAAAQKRVSNNYRRIVNAFLSPPCKRTDLFPLRGKIFTELFAIKINNRGKNTWPFGVPEFPWQIRLDLPPICEIPSLPHLARSRSQPPWCRRKIGCRVRVRPSLRAHFYGCVGKGREASSNEGTPIRRASRRTKKTRSTNFPDALARSIDVDFEWAGTRNFTGACWGTRGQRNVWIHDCRKYVNTS